MGMQAQNITPISVSHMPGVHIYNNIIYIQTKQNWSHNKQQYICGTSCIIQVRNNDFNILKFNEQNISDCLKPPGVLLLNIQQKGLFLLMVEVLRDGQDGFEKLIEYLLYIWGKFIQKK